MDDGDERRSGAKEQAPPKIKAEDNPWYLLATLYGVPGKNDRELAVENRRAWNRYFAKRLNDETRTKFIEEKRHKAEELMPYSPHQLEEIAKVFAERGKASTKTLSIPKPSEVIDFSNVQFDRNVSFNRYLFPPCSFEGATFSGDASFLGVTFSLQSDFKNATFCGNAIYGRVIFSGYANFEGATFSGIAFFCDAIFDAYAFFNQATFSKKTNADFRRVTFSANADFHGATFRGKAIFERATFSGVATFGSGAEFWASSSFVNTKMEGETSFEGTTFKMLPPKFFGATVHEGTIWRGITWPPVPKNKDDAGRFIDAYACLKLEMDRLKKHEDELDFFALEMQSRRVLLGSWGGSPIALFGALSDYGRSYLRPGCAIFYLALIGTLAFLPSDLLSPGQSLGLSIANMLNVFGFRKDFFDAATIEHLPAVLKVLAAAQTIVGGVLLFLFGLSIRNKFRMK
jgi:uncharacterized protein YjbI with pentapeptide repeats